MAYSKYGWAANQITEEDMARLYHLKKTTRKHITVMIGEAVSLYLSQHVPLKNTPQTLIVNKEEVQNGLKP